MNLGRTDIPSHKLQPTAPGTERAMPVTGPTCEKCREIIPLGEPRCLSCGTLVAPRADQKFIEIAAVGSGKRLARGLAYLLFYAVVAGLLGWLFVQFTGSLRITVLLVGFMVAYMTIAARFTEKNLERRDA